MAFKRLLKSFGPGIITGASDDDPSGIATYSQTGAKFGYMQLWTVLFTFPCVAIVQELCGKIGLVTGKGLAQVIRQHYGRYILSIAISLLFLANIVNIGADLGAMAASIHLIFSHFPIWLLLILITGITLVLEVFVAYKTYSRFLKYLTLSLFSYVLVAFMVKQKWGDIFFHTFVPKVIFHREYFMNIVALLGTTISPYLFFWQTAEEIEEEIATKKLKTMGKGKPTIAKEQVRNMRFDTTIGMFFATVIMWFIIITTASTLGKTGITNIETADQAAQALKPFAGEFAFLLFTLGIVGTGLLAVPVLAGSISYAIAETFHWKEGLYRKFHQAYGFYTVIIIAMLIGLLINLSPIKPFKMLYYTAVLNGLTAPPLLILILLISNNKKIMGNYTNSLVENSIGWIATSVMTLAAVLLLVYWWF